MRPESIGQYHECWSVVLALAPDQFRDIRTGVLLIDQAAALTAAFDHLRAEFHFAERKIKDERLARIARQLLEMSYEAYAAGEEKQGAHILQECEGLIWSSYSLRPKYAVEAERRVFGTNITYAGVKVSPYPYEGTAADLGADQTKLLALARRYAHAYLDRSEAFKYMSWVIDPKGQIKRTSIVPREDSQSVLPPVQRSFGYKRLKELAQTGEIRASVLVEVVAPLGNGLVSFGLEQRDRPRVKAVQLFERGRF